MHGADLAGVRALPQPTSAHPDRQADRYEAVPCLPVPTRTGASPRVLTGARLHNMYGPTEAAVDVTSREVTDTDILSVPIGAPVFKTRLYVLDSRLRSLPIAGELYLSGVQLTRRYLARAEPTPARFVADSFAVRPATHRELECLGRSGFQVKPRGWWIELGEVESVLIAVDSVVRVVAVVRDQPGIGEQSVPDGVESELDTRQLALLPAAVVRAAAEVAARLGAELNCPLGVRELRTATAVTELAELIERAGGSGGASLVAQLRARPRPPLVPLDAVRWRSTAALRTAVDAGSPFSALLVQVRERDVVAFRYVGMPFEHRVEALDPPRSQGRHPLFEVLFAFGNAEAIAVELPALSVAPSTLDTGVTEFDLQLTVTEYSAGAGLGEGSAPAGIPGEFARAMDPRDYARWQARFFDTAAEELSLRGPTVARGLPCAVRTFGRALRRRPLGPAGGRLSPTGDLVWWTRSGAKRFSGRTDHQVRVRGLRSNSVTSTPSSCAYAVDGRPAEPCGGCLALADDPGIRARQDRPRRHRGVDGPPHSDPEPRLDQEEERMTNPFDDADAKFYVLINEEGEHSLWPVFAAVPGGWTIAYGAANRKSCVQYVETHWVDMRPKSLIEAIANEAN